MAKTTDLIGAMEAARLLGVPRQYVWRDTVAGVLEAAMDVGDEKRPQYRYSRRYIEKIAPLYKTGKPYTPRGPHRRQIAIS